MIKDSIVFVLGAGASHPYGYPLGKGLVSDIRESLNNTVYLQLYYQAGFDDKKILPFKEALLKSQPHSIDSWLEKNPKFIDIGKFAIAHELLKWEKPRHLYSEKNKCHWYQYIFDKMNVSFEILPNNVSFITFNYDRSLRHYLHNALIYSYTDREKEECLKKLKNIKVIHLHGMLGGSLSDDLYMNGYYNSNPSSAEIMRYSQDIKIIYEDFDIDNDPAFQEAFNLLEKASAIYFLGFGYHELNLKRLNIAWFGKGKHVTGTSLGLKKAEIIHKQNLTNNVITLYNNIPGGKFYNDFDILQFLRNDSYFNVELLKPDY